MNYTYRISSATEAAMIKGLSLAHAFLAGMSVWLIWIRLSPRVPEGGWSLLVPGAVSFLALFAGCWQVLPRRRGYLRPAVAFLLSGGLTLLAGVLALGILLIISELQALHILRSRGLR
jgi:hypothetical protein